MRKDTQRNKKTKESLCKERNHAQALQGFRIRTDIIGNVRSGDCIVNCTCGFFKTTPVCTHTRRREKTAKETRGRTCGAAGGCSGFQPCTGHISRDYKGQAARSIVSRCARGTLPVIAASRCLHSLLVVRTPAVHVCV